MTGHIYKLSALLLALLESRSYWRASLIRRFTEFTISCDFGNLLILALPECIVAVFWPIQIFCIFFDIFDLLPVGISRKRAW